MSSLRDTRAAATRRSTNRHEFSEPHALDEPLPENARAEAIRTMAYLLAEARGFESGHELEDWFEAEQTINGTASRPH